MFTPISIFFCSATITFEKLTDRSFSASQTTQQRVFKQFNKPKQYYEQLTTHFQVFSLIGMDKLKNLCITRVVESSYTIKVPFPDALEKSEFLLCHIAQLQTPWQFHRYAICHSHVVHYKLLKVSELLVLHISLLDLCEQETGNLVTSIIAF